MCKQNTLVQKTYEEFSVKEHKCSLTGLTVENEDEIVFNGIDFNSGLLSFEQEAIECSVGTNQLKVFETKNADEINYSKIKKFKFVDCKFSTDTFFKIGLESLKFEDCIFEKRCYINNQYNNNSNRIKINRIEIRKTVFNENFKLHRTTIGFFYIEDTDFIKNADFFDSIFESGTNAQINFNAINFHGLALFGNTQFKQFLQFKYVTFQGYSHFRSATFEQGLDLEYANIEEEMNFFDIRKLDTKESKQKTSQETYRIIKYQLQKVGNIIGSNKYHSLELAKRRESLAYSSLLDKIVLNFHWAASNHSQNWLLPVGWIFVIGLLTCLSISSLGCDCCCYKTEHIFKYMSIVNLDQCLQKSPIIFFFNKVTLGYLYYQFLTAIRKDTRK